MHKNFENFVEYAQKFLKPLKKLAEEFSNVPKNIEIFLKIFKNFENATKILKMCQKMF
jgi:inorganic pyrophosphatase